jgi:DNA-directed RNA polymerase specialized sigma24 family protein
MREAVFLRVVRELPYDEVAAALGCSAGSARVRVSRGLDRLSQLLGGVA